MDDTGQAFDGELGIPLGFPIGEKMIESLDRPGGDGREEKRVGEDKPRWQRAIDNVRRAPPRPRNE